jgi:uncharacterized membrane protein YqjE
VDAVQTRLDLAATELEEERLRLERYVLLGIATLFFLSLGMLLFTALVVVVVSAFWKHAGPVMLGVFTVLYLGLGLWSAVTLNRLIKDRPKFLEATRAEIKRDKDRLARRRS